ncbi:hypothetical protein [Carnimonas bestiolae]|uniref:hypothetical protein n=1 Tax=Carnimonas bestiolae TaxID=3402172 RepID=UPI003EDC2057
MALQYQITAEAHGALDESVKNLYSQGEDGTFTLGVEGLPQGEDVTGLKAQRDQLLEEAKQAKAKAKELQDAQEKAKREQNEREGNYQQLYESAQTELQKANQRYEELTKANEQREIRSAAQQIASDIADGPNAEILADYVQRRLAVQDGNVRVTDADGNLTVSTLDQLKSEFANEPRFASLVRGSQAGGGGAAGTQGKGSGEMTLTEKHRLAREARR